jgi:uncharacterized protein (DUF1501 family)
MGLYSLFEAGVLALMQVVAAPLSHRSHFRVQEVWNSAMTTWQQTSTGWLGSYLDLMDSANPDNRTLAVHYSPDQPSVTRQAAINCRTTFDPYLRNFRETLL